MMNIHHQGSTRSTIEIYGENSASCGYCQQGKSVSFGGLSSSLHVDDFDMLMQRGWSRSGNYVYIPTHTTCCPQYIIRLHTQSFKLSRSQKRTIRKAESIATKLVNIDGNPQDTSIVDARAAPITSSSALSKPGLTISIEDAMYTQEKYLLYNTYMQRVHNKPNSSPSSFCDFLVNSPLVSPNNDTYGTFHMCYRLADSDALVAVSVLDFLPSGMISVYCFYDPDYKEYELGKYTILQEILYCQQHEIPAYYLGYYVHSCGNMRYKADYQPADLLCPIELSWHRYGDCVGLLNLFDREYKVYVPLNSKHREMFYMKDKGEVEKFLRDKARLEVALAREHEDGSGKSASDNQAEDIAMEGYKKKCLHDLFASCCVRKKSSFDRSVLDSMQLYASYSGFIRLNSILDPRVRDAVEGLLRDWVEYGGIDVVERFRVVLS